MYPVYNRLFEDIMQLKGKKNIKELYELYFPNQSADLHKGQGKERHDTMLKLYNAIMMELANDIASMQPVVRQNTIVTDNAIEQQNVIVEQPTIRPKTKEEVKREADEMFKIKRPLTYEERIQAYRIIANFHRFLGGVLRI